MEFSKKRNKVKADKAGMVGDERLVKIEGASLEIRDYGSIKLRGQDLILDLMSSGVNCITTCRETDEKISVKTEDGQFQSVTTGKRIPEGFKGLEYNTNTVLRTFFDKETGQICAEVVKDRTKVHKAGDIIEDPSLLDWQAALDKTKDKQEWVLKNDLTKAIEVEQELYKKEVLGSVGITEEKDVKEESVSCDTDIEEIKKEIIAKRNALSPVDKKAMKEKLESAGLPTAYKNVTDVDILNKVLEMFN